MRVSLRLGLFLALVRLYDWRYREISLGGPRRLVGGQARLERIAELHSEDILKEDCSGVCVYGSGYR